MAVLKIAEPGRGDFSSVRMALKISGKDERLKKADFRRFAATAGIPVAADTAMDELAATLARGVDELALPDPPTDGSVGAERAAQIRVIVRQRLEAFDEHGAKFDLERWVPRQGSNLQSIGYEPTALTIERQARLPFLMRISASD